MAGHRAGGTPRASQTRGAAGTSRAIQPSALRNATSGQPDRAPLRPIQVGNLNETLEVLASWAPGLHEALVGLGEGDFVIVDGTLIPTDRIRADEPYCSQKHKKHGMNIQVVTTPDGTPLWFSRATPGRPHDLTAA